MPALNFKARFKLAIQTGLKPHTIRARRKVPIRVGDVLYLYTGMRSKACERLLVRPCWATTPIQIFPKTRRVVLGEGAKLYPAGTLSVDWVHMLAVRDGFRDASDFFAFFADSGRRCFAGDLIEWDFSARIVLATAAAPLRRGQMVALTPAGVVPAGTN